MSDWKPIYRVPLYKQLLQRLCLVGNRSRFYDFTDDAEAVLRKLRRKV
jgi:hypothetical protein